MTLIEIQNDIQQNKISQNDILQDEITQNVIKQNGIYQNNIRYNDISQNNSYFKLFSRHYDNTYKDFTFYNFTYSIN